MNRRLSWIAGACVLAAATVLFANPPQSRAATPLVVAQSDESPSPSPSPSAEASPAPAASEMALR